MNLKNYYYYFQSALTSRFCDEVIKYGIAQQEELALTGDQTIKINEGKSLSEEDLKDLKKKRDSNIVWLNDRWIYKEIQPYMHEANRLAGWNFDWDYSESIQFTKYKLNQYYGWHKDSWDEAYGKDHGKNFEGKIRKLSCIVSLSDFSEYKGGELEFCCDNVNPDQPRNIFECQEIKPKGSIIVFPSHIYHQVKPVTEGTRYSLVIWNLGYPFK